MTMKMLLQIKYPVTENLSLNLNAGLQMIKTNRLVPKGAKSPRRICSLQIMGGIPYLFLTEYDT